jgi:RimJ/RimL family protein N-acetyltransferase
MALTTIRPFEPGTDRAILLNLLGQLRPSIAGVSADPVYRALVDDLNTSQEATCLLAFCADQLAGYVITVTNWHHYWRGFALRHPLVTGVVLGTRWYRRLRTRSHAAPDDHARQPAKAEAELAAPAGPSWDDRSAAVAKVVHIGVSETARGKGIATGLYANVVEFLGRRGIRRLEAMIDAGNHASLKLHASSGWTVRRLSTGYYAFVEIEPSGR